MSTVLSYPRFANAREWSAPVSSSPMSYSSGDDARERVRQATDIVELIGSYLELRRQGRNFVCRCPWHDDTKPSLQVNQERQSWKCWVCNIGGDVFSFVMQREAVGFREALQMLADKAGILLTAQKPQAPIEPGSPDDKATLYQAAAWAEKQFHDCLLHAPEAEAARHYFAERQISAESIQRFNLGYSPEGWTWLLERAQSTPFSPAVLEAVGLVGTSQNTGRQYDRFRGRVMFPIHNPQGKAIAFGGRVMPGATGDGAKYINSPETKLFTKSDNLYALDLASDIVRKSKKIIVVEGYTDVIVAHQSGLHETVAVLGTALNERHIKLLRRYADTVYLVLDGDEAGQRRTNEVLGLFVAEKMDLRIMTLPDEYDPAEFLLERSADEFRLLLDDAADALEHKIRVTTRGIDLARDTHQANRALEDILTTIAKAPRPSKSDEDSAQRLREQIILSRLSRDFSLPDGAIRQRLDSIRGTQARPVVEEVFPTKIAPRHDFPGNLPIREMELLELFVLRPDLVATALHFIGVEHLQAPAAREIFEVYRVRSEADEPVDFHYVLAMLESLSLKALLVELNDIAHERVDQSHYTPDERMKLVIRCFQKDDEERDMQEKTEILLSGTLSTEKENELLKQIYEIERAKHFP